MGLTNRLFAGAVVALALAGGSVTSSAADPIPQGWQARDFAPVGYSRIPAFKLAIRESGGRWYLYNASHMNGVYVVDVTNPENPVVVFHIDPPPNTGEGQLTLHGDLMITGMSRTFTREETNGSLPDPTLQVQPATAGVRNYSEGVRIWSLKDPARPVELSRWGAGALGAHRSGYPGGKYAYLSTTVPGYRGFMLIILDVSDPKHPKEAGRWWRPGQLASETPGDIVPSTHGPALPFPTADSTTLVAPYTPGVVTLDVSDPAHPKMIGKLDMVPPIADTGTQSLHTAIPLKGGKLIYFNSESKASDCKEAWQGAGIIDNSNPKSPQLLSIFPRPVPPPGLPYTDFCDKGGRFGPHNVNTEIYEPDVWRNDDYIHLTYFNAGLRLFDITDPRQPTEAGWFIPPDPTEATSLPVARAMQMKAARTEDVLVDRRGYVYISDVTTGIWILRYTGPVEALKNPPR